MATTARAADPTSSPSRPRATATAARPAGAFDLDGYPHLAYAPRQHGPGVWTEDGRASLAAIRDALAGGATPQELADRFGTTPAHVADAIIYLQSGRPLDPEAEGGGGDGGEGGSRSGPAG